jgi:nitrate reductase beta subunit
MFCQIHVQKTLVITDECRGYGVCIANVPYNRVNGYSRKYTIEYIVHRHNNRETRNVFK